MSAESYWIARVDAATARAERAEAAIERVRELAERWASREPHYTIEFRDAVDELLAALDSTDPVEAAPAYRWRVQFVMRRNDGAEELMGRHDFTDESAAREAFAGWVAEDRVDEYWRIEIRRQRTSAWETVEDTGYAAAALDGTHPDVPAPGRSGEEKP